MNHEQIAELRELREVNAHGDAYQAAAKMLGYSDLEQTFSVINRRHNEDGHLSFSMAQRRFNAYTEMMNRAKFDLPSHEYDALYQSF